VTASILKYVIILVFIRAFLLSFYFSTCIFSVNIENKNYHVSIATEYIGQRLWQYKFIERFDSTTT
jgi:hypothetical protein